jgi:two-component system response regulator RegX3
MRAAVVNADAGIGKLLRFVLTRSGYQTVVLQSAREALADIPQRETHAVILDTLLPDFDGFRLCQELRARGYAGPIIFVSSRVERSDKLTAFSAGADDFIGVPFDPDELLARIDVIRRHCSPEDLQPILNRVVVGDAVLDLSQLTFRCGNEPAVLLTPTEMRMLQCLMRTPGIPVSRETLIDRTWGPHSGAENNRVDVYVARIRKKIEHPGSHKIRTIRGDGYVFELPPSGAGKGKSRDRRAPRQSALDEFRRAAWPLQSESAATAGF